MLVTQKWKIADNIDSRVFKREISKTDNNLVRSYIYTRAARPATVALCGEIAPFNYTDQSNPPPLPLFSLALKTRRSRTGLFKHFRRRQSGYIEALRASDTALDAALILKWWNRGVYVKTEKRTQFYILRKFNRLGRLSQRKKLRNSFSFLREGENKSKIALHSASNVAKKSNRDDVRSVANKWRTGNIARKYQI